MKGERIKKRFLKELESYPVISVACKRANVDKSTIYRWRKKSKAFTKEMDAFLDRGRETVNDVAESHVINGVKEGEHGYVRYWLNNNHKRFIRPRPVNIFASMEPKKQIRGNTIVFENFSSDAKKLADNLQKILEENNDKDDNPDNDNSKPDTDILPENPIKC